MSISKSFDLNLICDTSDGTDYVDDHDPGLDDDGLSIVLGSENQGKEDGVEDEHVQAHGSQLDGALKELFGNGEDDQHVEDHGNQEDEDGVDEPPFVVDDEHVQAHGSRLDGTLKELFGDEEDDQHVEDHGNQEDEEGAQQVENERLSPPEVDMTFADASEVLAYCHQYGWENGFQVRIRSSELKKGGDATGDKDVLGNESSQLEEKDKQMENYKRLRLVCSKYGKFDSNSKYPGRGAPSSATGCQFRVNASVKRDGVWRVTLVALEHNHEHEPRNSKFLPNYRYINEGFKKRILDHDRAGVPVAKNFGIFVAENGHHDNVPFEERDCRNFIAKSRSLHMSKGDFAGMRKLFDEMSMTNSNFFYEFDLDEDNTLKNVFWADGRSRAAYLEFGDVVSFDTTYVSNRYRMPFAPFVGVNHHGQSVLFGCALLEGEEIANFVWLFRTWLKCMGGKAPMAILTDQCRSIGNAVAQVFPNTPHRWCIWHVMQNASTHLKQNAEWSNIYTSMQSALHDSLTISEFEDAWKEMIEQYGLEEHQWLVDMYGKRERWVPIFFKHQFWAGMSSTQRSEGMNHFFKKYVNSNTTLKLFVEQYGIALSNRIRDEEKANFRSVHAPVQCLTEHVFELVFQRLYTTSKFVEFQDEVRDLTYNNATNVHDDAKFCLYDIVIKRHKKSTSFRVTMDKRTMDVSCVCKNFEFRGILCSHVLSMFHDQQVDMVPAKYILDRWRKDLPSEHLKVSVPYYTLLGKKPDGVLRYQRMQEMLDCIAGFAMNDEELCKEVMASLDALTIKVKEAAKRKHGLRLYTLNNIGKVYGRRPGHHKVGWGIGPANTN